MGFRFRKSIKIGSGIELNLSKSGISTSIGVRGAQVAVGPMGQFKPLAPALVPEMKLVRDPGQKPRFMMIYHRSG